MSAIYRTRPTTKVKVHKIKVDCQILLLLVAKSVDLGRHSAISHIAETSVAIPKKLCAPNTAIVENGFIKGSIAVAFPKRIDTERIPTSSMATATIIVIPCKKEFPFIRVTGFFRTAACCLNQRAVIVYIHIYIIVREWEFELKKMSFFVTCFIGSIVLTLLVSNVRILIT